MKSSKNDFENKTNQFIDHRLMYNNISLINTFLFYINPFRPNAHCNEHTIYNFFFVLNIRFFYNKFWNIILFNILFVLS